jgi:hypothetical protein
MSEDQHSALYSDWVLKFKHFANDISYAIHISKGLLVDIVGIVGFVFLLIHTEFWKHL